MGLFAAGDALAQDEEEAGQGSGVSINIMPQSQEPGASAAVVVVDVQRILEEAQALQQVQQQLAQERQAFQNLTREREAELQQRDRELAQQRDTMDPDDFNSERDRLAEDLAGLQEDIRVWFRAHDRALNQSMRQGQDLLLGIVGELARQRGASVVLPRASVVLVQPDLDITEDALAILNRRLPRLPPPDLPAVPDTQARPDQ